MARPSKLWRTLSGIKRNLSVAKNIGGSAPVFLPLNIASRAPLVALTSAKSGTMQATPALRDALLGDLQSWRWVLSCRLSTVSHQWRLLCRDHHATLRELTLESGDDAPNSALTAWRELEPWDDAELEAFAVAVRRDALRTIALECGELRKLDLASVPLSYPGAAILAIARGCPHLVHLSLLANCLASVFGSLHECLGQQLEHLQLGLIGLDVQGIQATTWPALRSFGISGLGPMGSGLLHLPNSPLRMTCPVLEEVRFDDSDMAEGNPYPFSSYIPSLFTTGATSPSPLKVLKLVTDETEHRSGLFQLVLGELLSRFPLLEELEIIGIGLGTPIDPGCLRSQACSRLLVKAISQCQALTSLCLGWTHIFIDDFATLFRLPRLRELDLTGMDAVGSRCIHAIISSKQMQEQLCVLNLNYCENVRGRHIRRLIAGCPNLTRLNLEMTAVSTKAVHATWRELRRRSPETESLSDDASMNHLLGIPPRWPIGWDPAADTSPRPAATADEGDMSDASIRYARSLHVHGISSANSSDHE